MTRDWAGAGIRLNALAPGAILTPLLEEGLASPQDAKSINAFPVPIGGFGDPGELADWVLFMLSDSADFLCGSIVSSTAAPMPTSAPTTGPGRSRPGAWCPTCGG